MKTKKKVESKKKDVKKKRTRRAMIKSNLIGKLKKSTMTKTFIAKSLGYKSHNAITHWFKSGKMPLDKFNEVKKLLKIGK